MNLAVEVLIQSTLADEILLAVTAPKLGGVEGLVVLDCCEFKLEDHGTFVTITVFSSTLMLFQGALPGKYFIASVTCRSEYFV